MIFVTLGSQKFQFNRLLEYIDRLVEDRIITDEIFAQIGYSDYKPKNYEYKEFLDREEFSQVMSKCDTVITHGGTGAIIGAVKKNKKVIAIPRLSKFEEHVDDHQIEIVNQFHDMELILGVSNVEDLEKELSKIESLSLNSYESNTLKIIRSIEKFILN